jgi:hypothetical protein
MKKLLFTIAIILVGFSFVIAQPDNKQNRAEKVQALKIAFITQKLDFTSEEAQKFWPVYNRYESEIKQVMLTNKGGGDVIDNEEKVLNIKKSYRSEFIKVIGPPKTNTLFNAEREFRGVLMRHLKDKQNNRQVNKPNNSLRK